MSMAKWSLSGLSLLFFGASLVNAQTSFDVNLGFGAAWDGASTGGIDNPNSFNAYGACTLGTGDPNCQSLPSMNGFFLGFGADLMLRKHLGVGFDASLQPTLQNYGPLQYRQAFYDFNGIYSPFTVKHASLRLEGGIGDAHTGFSIFQGGCVGTAFCNNSSQPIGGSNHLDVHVGVGVQIYITEHIFVRPEFDFHYVPGLTGQFASDAVPEAMVWVGYSFGER